MAEALNPADWGATPVESPASWGAVAVMAPQAENSALPAAIADVPTEIGNAAYENIAAMKKGLTPSGQGTRGFFERSGDLAKGIAAIPGLVLSPVTGAVRSVGGHLMADAEHAVGSLIAPETAAKDDPKAMYERAKGDVDLAMSAVRPAGAPVRTVAPNSPPLKYDVPATKATFDWQAPGAPKLEPPTIQELKSASSAAYSSPEVVGLEIKPGTLKGYSDKTQTALNIEGFDDIVAPKTFALLQRVQQFPEGAVVTGQNLNSLRKTLGKLAGSTDPTEKAAASFSIDHLDDFIPKIPRSDILKGDAAAAAAKLEEARGNWAAASQAAKMDKRIAKAEMQADTANSGMNVENRIRTQMGKIAIDEREARGLTAAEVAQAKQIAEGTKTQNAMRGASNVMGGGGGMAMVVSGLPTAGVAPAVGFGLKLLSNRMTLKQASQLSKAIRMRAPLASSVEKFGEAFAKYHADNSSANYAGAVIAARNLSSNLQGAGFDGAISKLLRSLQTQQAGAEDQNDVERKVGR